jgi:hypothetical protein
MQKILTRELLLMDALRVSSIAVEYGPCPLSGRLPNDQCHSVLYLQVGQQLMPMPATGVQPVSDVQLAMIATGDPAIPSTATTANALAVMTGEAPALAILPSIPLAVTSTRYLPRQLCCIHSELMLISDLCVHHCVLNECNENSPV